MNCSGSKYVKIVCLMKYEYSRDLGLRGKLGWSHILAGSVIRMNLNRIVKQLMRQMLLRAVLPI